MRPHSTGVPRRSVPGRRCPVLVRIEAASDVRSTWVHPRQAPRHTRTASSYSGTAAIRVQQVASHLGKDGIVHDLERPLGSAAILQRMAGDGDHRRYGGGTHASTPRLIIARGKIGGSVRPSASTASAARSPRPWRRAPWGFPRARRRVGISASSPPAHGLLSSAATLAGHKPLEPVATMDLGERRQEGTPTPARLAVSRKSSDGRITGCEMHPSPPAASPRQGSNAAIAVASAEHQNGMACCALP